MFQYHTAWNYSSYTSGNNQENQSSDPLVKECPQLIHQSLWNGVGDPASINLTQMVLYFLEYISGCKVNDIHKIKVNMNLLDKSFKDKYHPPHADHKSNEWFSLIYYIKDSDGPTRFFNKTTRDPHPEKDLKVVGEVDPKKGRAILFKSNQMHITNKASDDFLDDDYQCKGYTQAYKFILKLRAQNKHLNNHEWEEMRKFIAYALDMKINE